MQSEESDMLGIVYRSEMVLWSLSKGNSSWNRPSVDRSGKVKQRVKTCMILSL